MTFQQSLNLCQRRRPAVDPIPAFRVQLKDYESKCRSQGYLTALDDTDGTFLENGSGVTGKEISANVNDKRKKCSDDNAFSKRDAEKKRKVMGPSIGPSDGPSIGPPPSAPTKVHLKTHSIGPKQRPSIGPSIGPTMPAKDISGPFMPASAESIAGEKLDEK